MSDTALILFGIFLFAGSAFFVAAEFAVVSARVSRISPLAKKGSGFDILALGILKEQPRYVAGTQVGITFLNIAIGSALEPELSHRLERLFPSTLPEWIVRIISIIIVSYPLVVAGELVPKYLALQFPEQTLRLVAGPLRLIVVLIRPIIWLFETSGQLLLKAMKINMDSEGAAISREELHFMIRSGEESGGLHEDHADVIAKTLRLDELDAEDAMLHRLDIKWLHADATKEDVLEQLAHIGHSRIPVCQGDIDDIVGIAYLNDIVLHLQKPVFDLKAIARPAVYVPESLTLNRLVEIMRETKTQIVIVQDEYGGTQGLVTLEDVVEEIFGDLEDSLESDRPAIERTSPSRISTRPDVRYDELIDFLEWEEESDPEYDTQTLAAIIVDKLERTPKLGDTVEIGIGRLRVEQAAKNRITRIGFYPVEKVFTGEGE